VKRVKLGISFKEFSVSFNITIFVTFPGREEMRGEMGPRVFQGAGAGLVLICADGR